MSLRGMATVVVLGLVIVGCSENQTPSVLSEVTDTTTTSLSLDETADLPELPGTPPDEIVRNLEQAVASRDMCALASAMDSGLPETNDPDAVIDAYVTLERSIIEARAFRPNELAGPWDELEAGLGIAIEELEATVGRTDAPSVVAVFTSDAMQAAVRAVQRWATQNCPEPTS